VSNLNGTIIPQADSKASKRLLTLGFALLPISIGPTLFGLRVFFLVAATLIVSGCFLNRRRDRVQFERFQVLFLVLFFVSALFAAIFSPVANENGSQAWNWILLTSLCMALAVFVKRSFVSSLTPLLNGLMLLGGFDAIFIFTSIALERGSIFSATTQRAFLFEYYLQDAFYCALAGILFLSSATLELQRRRRNLLIISGALCAGAMILLASRGAILAFAAGLIFGFIALLRKGLVTKSISYVAIVLVGLVLVFLFTPAGNQVVQRFQVYGDAEALNQVRRANFQTLALSTVSQNPFGLGWNGFSTITSNSLTEAVRSTHNMYLSLCLDIGWIGALSYLLIILVILKHGLSTRAPNSNILVASLLVAYLIEGLNDSPHVLPVSMGANLLLLVLYGGSIVASKK